MRTFILMFAVFMDLILLTRFKMHIKTVLFCAGLELMAFFCFSEAGFYSLFFCFFIIGILKWIRKILKKRSDVSSYKISNFLYSAGIPIVLCLWEFVDCYFVNDVEQYQHKIDLLIVCSIAAIISDTAASEIGQLFKVKTYSIIKFCPVEPGEDGGVSFIRTISSMMLTLIFMIFTQSYISYHVKEFVIVYLFSIVSCFIDSILGATIQKKGVISNEQTNFFSVLFTVMLIFFI